MINDLDIGTQQLAQRGRADRGRGYASFTKYFPGNCFTSRFSSRARRVEETVPLGKFDFVAISSICVSVASIASYTRRSSSESGGSGRAAAWGDGFVSGKRIWRSSKRSFAS